MRSKKNINLLNRPYAPALNVDTYRIYGKQQKKITSSYLQVRAQKMSQKICPWIIFTILNLFKNAIK